MPLPEADVALVREYVEQLSASMPPHAARQLRYRVDIDRNAVTIVESSRTDPDDESSPWFDVSVARLRFFRSRGWELYWADRDSAFHLYEMVPATQDVTVLLEEIEEDPTGIFFG